MSNQFLTNYTGTTFLDKIKDNLRHCTSFDFSVSFIKKAGLVLLYKDIEAAVERGCEGRIIKLLKNPSNNQVDTDISVEELIDTIEYDYPNFHLSMDCFWCEILCGDLNLKEHEAARWLDKESLYSVDWLPADISIIEKIKEKL